MDLLEKAFPIHELGTNLGWKVYLLYSILQLRLLGIEAAVPNLERVVLPLIIRPKGGGYYTRAALIRVRNLLQRIRYAQIKTLVTIFHSSALVQIRYPDFQFEKVLAS